MIQLLKYITFFAILGSQLDAGAAPIDWKGTLGFDTRITKDARRTSDDCTVANGSQCINPEEDNARFQSMLLKLNPNLIVNDGVTVKAEITSNGTRTNRMGNDTQVDNNSGAYYTQSTTSAMNLNQVYAEIYADTALYRVGRFAKHWGLGAVVNDGSKVWDRFYSGYEGIEAQLKLGNFHLTPMWAKLHTSNQANGKYDSYETSVAALYDNPNKNFKFGVYYSIKEVESSDTLYNSGSHNVTLIDVFFARTWDKYGIGLEIPMLSGEVGDFYNTGSSNADFEATSYILETYYQLNSKWKLELNAGIVKGDDGETSNIFEGMYLHPNYQLSEMIFKYNAHGYGNNNFDIFNSSITNATYANLKAIYSVDEWTWNLSFLWATANEVASSGDNFYDHDKKAVVTATEDQSNDLGYAMDISFDYQWNPNVIYSGNLGYHQVGDFYSFNNSSDELSVTNVTTLGMSLSVSF